MSGQATSVMTMTVLALTSAGLFWLLREHWGHAPGVAHGHGHAGDRK